MLQMNYIHPLPLTPPINIASLAEKSLNNYAPKQTNNDVNEIGHLMKQVMIQIVLLQNRTTHLSH